MNISKEQFTKLAKEHLIALESYKMDKNGNNPIEIFGIEKLYEAINYTHCSTQLKRESKSFTNLKTIADIQRLYPNQESYGVSISDGLQKFYVNNEVIYTKALIV